MSRPVEDAEFQAIRLRLQQMCGEVMEDRAGKYERGVDRLSYFRLLAKRTGVDEIDVCVVLLSKHLANIDSMIEAAKEGRLSRVEEDIFEPFCDSRNYYDFLLALLLTRNDVHRAED